MRRPGSISLLSITTLSLLSLHIVEALTVPSQFASSRISSSDNSTSGAHNISSSVSSNTGKSTSSPSSSSGFPNSSSVISAQGYESGNAGWSSRGVESSSGALRTQQNVSSSAVSAGASPERTPVNSGRTSSIRSSGFPSPASIATGDSSASITKGSASASFQSISKLHPGYFAAGNSTSTSNIDGFLPTSASSAPSSAVLSGLSGTGKCASSLDAVSNGSYPKLSCFPTLSGIGSAIRATGSEASIGETPSASYANSTFPPVKTSQLPPLAYIRPTGFVSPRKSSKNDTALFAYDSACASSWSSQAAGAMNGSVATTMSSYYTITVTAHITTTVESRVLVGPTIATLPGGVPTAAVGRSDSCCNQCVVRYPAVRVYYWQTNSTNTGCVKQQTKSVNYAGPQPPSDGSTGDRTDSNFSTLSKARVVGYAAVVSGAAHSDTSASTAATTSRGDLPPRERGIGQGFKRAITTTTPFYHRPAPTKQRDVRPPGITPRAELPLRAGHKLMPREFTPLGGYLSLNSTDPSLANVTLNGNETDSPQVFASYALVDGSTFISPSIYVVFSSVFAQDKCGTVGKVHTSLTYAYDENELSSVDALGQTKVYNFADLPCPPETNAPGGPNPLEANTAWKAPSAADYHPTILGPSRSLMGIDPAWATCTILDVGEGYDSPKALKPQGRMNLTSVTIQGKAPIYKTKEAALVTQTPLPALALVPPAPQKQTVDTNAKTTHLEIPHPVSNAPILINGQTIAPNAPPVTINKTPVQVVTAADANSKALIVGSRTAALPKAQVLISTVQPLVAGGMTLTPQSASTSIVQTASPVAVGDLTFSVAATPNAQVAKEPVKQQPAPGPGESMAKQLIGNSVTHAPSSIAQPITAGGMTFNPVIPGPPNGESSGNGNNGAGNAGGGANGAEANVGANNSAGKSGEISKGSGGAAGNNNGGVGSDGVSPGQNEVNKAADGQLQVVVSGGTPTEAVNGSPINLAIPKDNNAHAAGDSVVENGITMSPVPAGPEGNTPLGVVGGKTLSSNSPGAVIGGSGFTAGPMAVVSGTSISYAGNDNKAIAIGTNMVPVPTAIPQSLGVLNGQTISGDGSKAVIDGTTINANTPVDIHGTQISLGGSSIAIGTNTVALPTAAPQSLGVVNGQTISGDASKAVIDGTTINANIPVDVHGTPVYLGGSSIAIGSSTIALPATNFAASIPLGVLGGQPITGNAESAVVDGIPIQSGSPPVTIDGTPVSLGSKAIAIGTNTVPLPSSSSGLNDIETAGSSAFAINGQTVTSGGPPITVSNTPVSLGPSGLVVGSSTIPITATPSLTSASPDAPVYAIDGTAVTQGGPAIFVSGTRVSLGPSGVFIGSKTVALPSSSALTIGSQQFTPNPTGFSIAGTSLTPGAPEITVSGTKISLASNSELVIGSSTIAVPAPPSPTISVGGNTFTSLNGPQGGLEISGTTLTPGSSGEIISGTSYSINPSGSLLINASTIALAHGSSPNGLQTAAHETFSALGSDSISINGTTLTAGGPGIVDDGTSVSLTTNGLVIGSSTYAYATPASVSASPTNSVFTVDGQTFTAQSSGIEIDGTSISVGGPAVTMDGANISLGSSALVVGSDTVPLTSITGLMPILSSGESGVTAASTPTGDAGIGRAGTPAPGAGAAKKGIAGRAVGSGWWLLGVVAVGWVVMWS